MTIFDLLKKDHREAKALLKKIENADDVGKREKLFTEVKGALAAHSRSEEKAVYDAVQNEKKTHDMIMEGFEEHHVLDDLLEKLSSSSPSEDAWIAKITVLREILEHHIEEEEEDLFKKIKSICDEEQLTEMAETFQQMKSEMMAHSK